MSIRFPCKAGHGVVFAQCDAADLPKLSRFTWCYHRRRGVRTSRVGNAMPMQATSLLCGWAQVQYANGDKLDLRRANLVKIAKRGAAPKCRPMKIRENLWRVQRIIGHNVARLQLHFSDYGAACAAGERLRSMSRLEVLAEIAKRRGIHSRAGTVITFDQFFDGRSDIADTSIDFSDFRQMSHLAAAG